MNPLRRTRTEMAGAWRSLRYDLGRAPVPPPGDGPDVTSTGMGTWGLPGLIDPAPADLGRPAPAARRPRRTVAMTAFGTLSVIGAAAAYLAMVNGLGSLMEQSPAAAEALPPRAAVTTAARMGSSATAGRVATTAPTRPRPVRKPPVVRVPPAAPAATLAVKVPAGPPLATTEPVRVAGPKRTVKPTSTDCHCQPPVPTPTSPPSPTWPPPSSSAPSSPGPTGPDPSISESVDPSESVSPSRSGDGHRHQRHH